MEVSTSIKFGSNKSIVFGHPVLTLQYEQARVQVSPNIINVAVPLSQQSPIFGQAASSQTVFRLAPEILDFREIKFSLPGDFTLNHSGNLRFTTN